MNEYKEFKITLSDEPTEEILMDLLETINNKNIFETAITISLDDKTINKLNGPNWTGALNRLIIDDIIILYENNTTRESVMYDPLGLWYQVLVYKPI